MHHQQVIRGAKRPKSMRTVPPLRSMIVLHERNWSALLIVRAHGASSGLVFGAENRLQRNMVALVGRPLVRPKHAPISISSKQEGRCLCVLQTFADLASGPDLLVQLWKERPACLKSLMAWEGNEKTKEESRTSSIDVLAALLFLFILSCFLCPMADF